VKRYLNLRSLADPTRFAALAVLAVFWMVSAGVARAGEADLAIPDLHAGTFEIFGQTISAWNLLFYGALVISGSSKLAGPT
jgi:hypothetical protein